METTETVKCHGYNYKYIDGPFLLLEVRKDYNHEKHVFLIELNKIKLTYFNKESTK